MYNKVLFCDEGLEYKKFIKILLIMMYRFFCLIILIGFFTMCKKSGNGYVKGTVLEKGTGTPISGIKVYVTDTKYGSTNHKLLASSVTDENGNYRIEYYKNPTHNYTLRTEENDKFYEFGFKGLDYKKFAFTIELYPK